MTPVKNIETEEKGGISVNLVLTLLSFENAIMFPGSNLLDLLLVVISLG